MFCDMVDSTALSGRLDVEPLKVLLDRYRKLGEAAAAAHGGIAKKHEGDSVVAFFGYSETKEESVVEAIRAGLAFLAAIRAAGEDSIQVRIAVHTGELLIPEFGGGALMERDAEGLAINIAARLQAVAKPGGMVVSGATYRLARDYFSFAAMGAVSLKGLPPLQFYEVLSERDVAHPLQARSAEELTPLIGRDEELASLERAWQAVRGGAGQSILMVGDPGVGKSRLLRAFRERLDGSPPWLEAFAHESTQHAPLRPLLELGRRYFGANDAGALEERYANLVAALDSLGIGGSETAALLSTFLGGVLPNGVAAPSLEPAVLRDRALTSLREIFVRQAAMQPTIFVIEDLHWADDSTLEAARNILGEAPPPGLLVLATARPRFVGAWTGERLPVSHLSSAGAEEMMMHLAGERFLPASVVATIGARADGIPLYLEELTHALIESADAAQAWALPESAGSAVPAPLRDSLQGRLDRLGEAREIALYASVLGREFPAALLEAAWQDRPDELANGLARLIAARILLRDGSRLLFRHALLCEAAYHSMLVAVRQRHHERVCELLDGNFSALRDAQPEYAAQHFAAAGRITEAIASWREAARLAMARHAMVELAVHLRHVLRLVTTLPESPRRAQEELESLLALGGAIVPVEGYGSSELADVFSRALILAEQMGATPVACRAHSALAGFFTARIEWEKAREQIAHLQSAALAGDRLAQMQAALFHGVVLMYRGTLSEASGHFGRAVGFYEGLGARPTIRNLDSCVLALGFGGWCEKVRGNDAVAGEMIQRAADHARSLADDSSIGWVMHIQQLARYGHDDPAGIVENGPEHERFHREHSQTQWLALSQILRGWALARVGRAEEGLALLRNALDKVRKSGQLLAGSHYHLLHASACLDAARLEEAREALAAARRIVERGERLYEPEIHRIEAQAHLAAGEPERAAESLGRAISTARETGASLWGARARLDLAALLNDLNRTGNPDSAAF